MNVLNLTINNGEMLNDNTLTKTIDADDKNLDKKKLKLKQHQLITTYSVFVFSKNYFLQCRMLLHHTAAKVI